MDVESTASCPFVLMFRFRFAVNVFSIVLEIESEAEMNITERVVNLASKDAKLAAEALQEEIEGLRKTYEEVCPDANVNTQKLEKFPPCNL